MRQRARAFKSRTRTLTVVGFSPEHPPQRAAPDARPPPVDFVARRVRRASDTPAPDGGEGEGRLAPLLAALASGLVFGVCGSFLFAKAAPCQVGAAGVHPGRQALRCFSAKGGRQTRQAQKYCRRQQYLDYM